MKSLFTQRNYVVGASVAKFHEIYNFEIFHEIYPKKLEIYQSQLFLMKFIRMSGCYEVI